MSEELGKYREVFDMKRVNELHSQGYSLKETVVEIHTDDDSGRICSNKSWIMSLKEDGKYDDMEAFKKVPITNEWTLLEQGVEAIHHTSKEMILKRVKTNEPSDTGVPKQG